MNPPPGPLVMHRNSGTGRGAPQGPLVINSKSAPRASRSYQLKPDRCGEQYRIIRHGSVLEVIPVVRVVGSKQFASENQTGRKITGLSKAAWGRMVCKLSRLQNVHGFGTLTYPDDWRSAAPSSKLAKKKLRKFTAELRDRWPDCGGGVWILEFQKRGAPHFHLWTCHDRAPADWTERDKWFRKRWIARGGGKVSEWVPVRKKDAAARYAAKEGGKRYQKDPPPEWDPGSYYGIFGRPSLAPVDEIGTFFVEDLPIEVSIAAHGKPYRTNWVAAKETNA